MDAHNDTNKDLKPFMHISQRENILAPAITNKGATINYHKKMPQTVKIPDAPKSE
jgi:hypothetical protein